MRSSFIFLAALCAIPALAQNGANCDIVANQTVKAGDTLAGIAKSTNVSLDQIEFVNPQITNPSFIKVGDIIKIPDTRCVAPAAKPLADPTATCSNGTSKTITVVAGDTLTIIAKQKLGITLPSLLAANPQIKDSNAINVGDVINIPLCNGGTKLGGSAVPNAGSNSTSGASAAKATRSGKVSAKAVDPTATNSMMKSKRPKSTSAAGAAAAATASETTKSKTKSMKASQPPGAAKATKSGKVSAKTANPTGTSFTTETKKPKTTNEAGAAAETTKSKTKTSKASKLPAAAKATEYETSKAPKATKRSAR